jgi:hypothetical protein
MSSRNLNFIDRLRSKSFDKAIISGNNLANYHYVDNFDNITEEECLKIDTKNKEIYKKNMDLYENISKQIEHKNAMFKIDSPPMPPVEPNNYDRFITNRMRNITRNVRYQSYAVYYLLNKNYKIIFDTKQTKSENEFEPYEAIDICEKLENMTIDLILKKEFQTGQNSPNNYNNRKSIVLNTNTPPNYYPLYPSVPSTEQYYPTTPQLSSSAPVNSFTYTSPYTQQIQPSQSILSSSPPQKQLINAPPASHYIHHN